MAWIIARSYDVTRGDRPIFGLRHRTLVTLALPGGAQVDSGEDQRQLSRAHLDRDGVVGNRRKLERAGLESFVPDRQTIAIPIENLETVAASIDEQEQVTGCRILAKRGGNQAGKRIEAFTEIGGGRVRNTRTA